eukprot:TRINITY_DN2697_c0_g1_i2.p1 TRINITY_DN2697_c0_g1~~TRINITY_DN2697_c0_g1_i2.p1  ORF type:complete len:106 (-),score=32.37 TRINITY_DN2697_c0_g1_i2:150-467(-)
MSTSENQTIEEIIDELIEENDVLIFSKTWCGYCSEAKQVLKSTGADVKIVELDKRSDGSKIQNAIKKREKHNTVPAIYIKKQFIGGCSDLNRLSNKGELTDMIEA